jgi:hypothetical protein
MAKSAATCNSLLLLLFNATNWANIADNAASAPLTSLYLSLHTATVGTNDAQTTTETSYTNYVRVGVLRASGAGGFTVSTNTAKNTSLTQFAQCGASGATITDVAVGTASGGAGHVLYTGALNSSLAVSNGIQPQFSAQALTITET